MINFLSRAKVTELTGKIRYCAQVRALRKMKIDFRIRPDGRPLVDENDVIINKREIKRNKENELDFSAL